MTHGSFLHLTVATVHVILDHPSILHFLNVHLSVQELPSQQALFCCQGYPPDEAATYEMLVYRHAEAPDLLLGAYLNTELVGVGGARVFVVLLGSATCITARSNPSPRDFQCRALQTKLPCRPVFMV